MRDAATPDDRSDADLVTVASAGDQVEGEMIRGLLRDAGISSILQPTGINGPMLGIGLLPHGAQRVMVHANQRDAARRLLADTAEEGGAGVEELANATYLDDAGGRGPRSYGLVGAYARIWFWSLLALGVTFGVFLIARGT